MHTEVDNNRRYYLHSKLKKFCRFDVYKRTIYMNPEDVDQLNTKQKFYLAELVNKHQYVIQTEIR